LLTDEEIRRLEQVWLVLSDFFRDLGQRNISVDIASDLRDCKTLIHFIRTSVAYPSKEPAAIYDPLQRLLQIFVKVRSILVSEALRLGENYVNAWMRKLDEAERADTGSVMIYARSEFVPSLPRDSGKGWIRLTLRGSVAEERVQDIAEEYGVIVEFRDDFHILITGRGDSVKKAASDIHELSLE